MDFSRQMEAFNQDTFNTPVNIIGAGATGSWVALILAKMGIKDISVYDFDIVEEHNLPNQAFGIDDIGLPKVDAINELIEKNTNTFVKPYNIKVDGSTKLNGIVFMLTDTMKSRDEIWRKAIKANFNCELLIETRMGIDGGRIYTLDPRIATHWKKYEGTLYSDSESAVSACGTSQSIVATALLISSLAVWQLIHYHNGEKYYNEILVDVYGNMFKEEWE